MLLVTHERKLAEFYAERIIEIKDGKVVKDYQNDSDRYLDYQLENKIYLKDIPVKKSFADGETQVDLYSDAERSAEIRMVIRGGNLYIDTGGHFNVVDENSNIEMIDDHYKVMDSSIYEQNEFRYDECLPANFKARYRSLYTPWNMLWNGFKAIGKFRFLKKLLLVGFVFAAMFAFLAASNVCGIFKIEEKDFLTTNAHYITVSNPSHESALLEEVAALEGVEYVLPGDSKIRLSMPMDDYYQTSQASAGLTGSMVYAEMLSEAELFAGRVPEGDHEIVIDKMILDRFLKAKAGKMVGITSMDQFLGRKIRVPNLSDYTIVGISDTNSPSIFIPKSQYLYILTNVQYGDDENAHSFEDWSAYEMGSEGDGLQVMDYSLAPEAVKIKRGSEPDEVYEVIVNNSHYEEEGFKIGKTIDRKVNGHKLLLVGFYTSDRRADICYVTAETLRQEYIGRQKSMAVYAEDPEMVLQEIKDLGLSAKINYDRDRTNYLKAQKSTIRSGLVVAGIILLISLIEMFLMLRSSFLSRIREVGIMRAIGLKKRDIYRMFAGEILAITLVTAIPGIAIMYYILLNLVKITDYLEGLYLVEPFVAVAAFVIIIVFNLLVGLIPVFRTMRKTPAAILSRTDI